MRSGIKTSEMALALLAIVVAFVLGAGWLGDGSPWLAGLTALSAALASFGYSGSMGT